MRLETVEDSASRLETTVCKPPPHPPHGSRLGGHRPRLRLHSSSQPASEVWDPEGSVNQRACLQPRGVRVSSARTA